LRDPTPAGPKLDRAERWRQTVSQAYFPLDLRFSDPAAFSGELTRLSLGEVRLSRLRSEPASYERRRQHISATTDEEYLVTIPVVSAVEFSQLGREVRCAPGGFLIERGHEPYRFLYGSPNDLFVLKVGARTLAERIGAPDRLGASVFDASQGVGRLFATMVAQAQSDAADVDAAGTGVIGRQLLELLGLAIANDPRALASTASSVRAAHLRRAERYIRANLADPDLSPERVAEACGISRRYLHDLFRDMSSTVAQRIRDERLIAARDRLEVAGSAAIADVAYRFGFSDQAQFSRLFKQAFGQTPSGYRRRIVETQAATQGRSELGSAEPLRSLTVAQCHLS
jgi:AraC-like DNA-binding protein